MQGLSQDPPHAPPPAGRGGDAEASPLPPRLARLLHVLLRNAEPVPVRDLGARIGVSRRTVFRDLCDADAILAAYGVRVYAEAGRGVALAGDGPARDRLREALEAGGPAPSGPGERRLRLALLMLEEGAPRKLLWYADLLGVSAATVSGDLDRLGPWFAGLGVSLVRGRGGGPSVEGDERSLRGACVEALRGLAREAPAPGRPGRDAPRPCGGPSAAPARAAEGLGREIDRACPWMTPESREALDLYLAAAIPRMLGGRFLGRDGAAAPTARARAAAEGIASAIEAAFPVSLGEGERLGLAERIASCRSAGPVPPAREGDPEMRRQAYAMIDAFDPALAPVLKLDEDLVNGLALHMRPALARIASRMWLEDPLLGQIAESYPDLLAGSARALGLAPLAGVPSHAAESEASFLATHFGAALHRLEERGLGGRELLVGVVCLHGIGTSHMLASQLRRQLPPGARVEVGCREGGGGWGRYDLLVSTVPLEDPGVPVVVAPAILDGESVLLIRSRLEALGRAGRRGRGPRRDDPGSLSARCGRLAALCEDVRALLDGFEAVEVEEGTTLAGLAGLAARRFAGGGERGRLVLEGLLEREGLSSQVIPELGIVLLHCLTGGADGPALGLAVPRGGVFTDPRLRGSRACVILLMPPGAPPERLELMGCVSSALVADEAFLAAVKGLGGSPRELLGGVLRGFLDAYIARNWKG